MPAGYHPPGWTAETEHQREWQKAHPGRPLSEMPPYHAPGPARRPSAGTTYTGGSSGGKYDLGKYSSGAVSEAQQIVSNYGDMIGWPGWYNGDAMLSRVLEQGLQNNPEAGYKYLWALTPHSIRDQNVNAFFGLTKQQYLEKLNSLSDMFNMYTGSDTLPSDLRNQAISENWTQTELMSHLQKNPGLTESAPWVAVGLTYRDIATQFGSTYGHAPEDPTTLASWWKFRTGAQSVGGGGPAAQVAAPPPPLTARSLSSDVETR